MRVKVERDLTVLLEGIELEVTVMTEGTNYDNGFEVLSVYTNDSCINIIDLLDQDPLDRVIYAKLKEI